MPAPDVRAEINKRLTLNWLIQGAAQHAGLTAHHLVRGELDALHPHLVGLYDQYALINLLQYWRCEAALLLGWPPRFWRRAATRPGHPFFAHPLLSRHGGRLAAAARERARARAKEKGLSTRLVLFGFQMQYVVARLVLLEAKHARTLGALAVRTTTMVWGIPPDRLDAAVTKQVAFGSLSVPRTLRGRLLRGFAVGYGGVLREGGRLRVVARGTNFYLVAKELVKGTAELVCLHGLNGLDDATYAQVMREADQLEFEPWMLQTGGELWRRLLAATPAGWPPAELLMHLARLPAPALEGLLGAAIERPDRARELLAGLRAGRDLAAGRGPEPGGG
jgi:hypothetical protein